MHEGLAFGLRSDREREARKIVSCDDAQDFKLEATVCAFGSGFLKQDRHGDGKAVGAVSTRMLARDAIEPALTAAGYREILGIDGKHAAILRHSAVEPVGDSERDAPALFGLGIDEILPPVNPG